MVFLPGYCSRARGYADSFAHAAASRGTLVTMQADTACKDEAARRWTNTTSRLDARIEAVFRAAGDTTPLEDLTILGYSEGAVLAEMLASAKPARYARVVLIGAPRKPEEWRLRHARAVVLMAGQRDAQEHLIAGKRALAAAGIPSTFLELPGAKHGEMGSDPERVMAEALDFLQTHAR